MKMNKWTIAGGSPFSGMSLYGLFDTAEEAISFAEQSDFPEEWHVIAIHSKEDF